MKAVMLAAGRALRSLKDPGTFWHMVWPALVASLAWLFAAVYWWSDVVGAIMGWIEGWPWVGGWLTESPTVAAVFGFMVDLTVAFALLPLIYLTSAVLVSVIAIPLMLERVGRRDYAELELRRGGSNLGSAWNALVAAAIFVAALLASLPLWLIPGLGLVISVLLTAWLNRRAFGYDALMLHADRDELALLPARLKQPMFVLGGGCALLAHVPFVNIVAPAFSGLAFVHFMLEALRRERGGAGVEVLDRRPERR
ncbi:MAG TPA: EI24 domain-containing protein [Rhodocyclaceae bacterium]|nr:EI24 domain-containing protein [Rhodocyclaceae bacterium]